MLCLTPPHLVPSAGVTPLTSSAHHLLFFPSTCISIHSTSLSVSHFLPPSPGLFFFSASSVPRSSTSSFLFKPPLPYLFFTHPSFQSLPPPLLLFSSTLSLQFIFLFFFSNASLRLLFWLRSFPPAATDILLPTLPRMPPVVLFGEPSCF